MAPPLTFVVPVRDDARRLRQCLASIAANSHSQEFDVIVADNGSRDDSAAVARHAGATVLELPDVNVAAMRNAAARQATGGLLAFVDADHLIDPGWVDAALRIFEDPGIAAAGAHYASPPNANWVQRAYGRFRPAQKGLHDTDWLGSGNLVVRRDVFNDLGGFDTSLETCEDVDLCNRMRLKGLRLVGDDRLRSVHQGDPASIRAVFLGELWRGRNNLRVTMRGPLTVRALPSLLIPVFNLLCLAMVSLGAFVWPWVGLTPMLLGMGGLVLTMTLRLARMLAGGTVSSAAELIGTAAVVSAYEAARALSLVVRATHRTRREAARA
jgi:cellulose synthase/poly-beta-1,6-N-acetylglucosamine synthase-like glycosyltransferase